MPPGQAAPTSAVILPVPPKGRRTSDEVGTLSLQMRVIVGSSVSRIAKHYSLVLHAR